MKSTYIWIAVLAAGAAVVWWLSRKTDAALAAKQQNDVVDKLLNDFVAGTQPK